MERIPEPELMDDPAQARAYASADFSEPHQAFIEHFRAAFPDITLSGHVLDLGCGPADISIRFAKAYTDCRILGVDAAAAMLAEGHAAVTRAGLEQRIELLHGYLPTVELPAHDYAAVICNSLLHHLHEPAVLWETICRYAARGAPVCVMDLLRPASPAAAAALRDQYAADAPAVLQQDFYNSLLAAYSLDEVKLQLQSAGLSHLSAAVISDRHWLVTGRR
ncbi:MAG: class I SAM-dependent methyltransferase [Gammaproteobacteria bacterium]